MYKAPRGTVDILPAEQSYWAHVQRKAADVCRLYGYERLDTPVFEDYSLFARADAEGTDLVEKEMYVFEDRSGQKLALRPENTAPVCRAYVEHGMFNLAQPIRLYYLGAAFRYERPQAGRYRQHNQFGCEALGDASPSLDVEVIELAIRFLEALGLKRLSVLLNSIGCRECQPEYVEVLRNHYKALSERVCDDCRIRMVRNPLRLLDCKEKECRAIADEAPHISDYLCPECNEHFQEVQDQLRLLGIPFALNHKLVRGLDYYTRTVFEVLPEREGGQSAIVGGGRYDGLIEQIGGKPTPGVGFATGMERIILNLKEQGVEIPEMEGPTVYLACMGQLPRHTAVGLARQLRDAGIGVVSSTGSKSLKAQLRQSNSLNMKYSVIIGENEVQAGTAIVRDMSGNEQLTLPLDELVEYLSTPPRTSAAM
ncbi:MAG: histidine--tRNA ligase [Dehalococcoidia bacterium]|nr:histidine--tRNA ligase [Dehalococcoidia bacterium]